MASASCLLNGRKRKLNSSKKGMALSTTICLTVVLLIFTAAIISVAVFNLNYTSGSLQSRQAYLDVKSALSYCESYYVNHTVPGVDDETQVGAKVYFFFSDGVHNSAPEIWLQANDGTNSLTNLTGGSAIAGGNTVLEEKKAQAKSYVVASHNPETSDGEIITKESFVLEGYAKNGALTSSDGDTYDKLSLVYNVSEGHITPQLDEEDEADIQVIEEYKYVNIHVKPYNDSGLEPYLYTWAYNAGNLEKSLVASGQTTPLSGEWLSNYDAKPVLVKDKSGNDVYVFPEAGPQGAMQYEGNGWYSYSVMVPVGDEGSYAPDSISAIVTKQNAARNYSIVNGQIVNKSGNDPNTDGQTAEIYGIPLPEKTGYENAEDVYITLNTDKFVDYPYSRVYTNDAYNNTIKDTITVYQKKQNTNIHFRVANQTDDSNITGTPYVWVQSYSLQNGQYVAVSDVMAVAARQMVYEGYGWYRFSGLETAGALKVWIAIDSTDFSDAIVARNSDGSNILIGGQVNTTENESEIGRELYLTAWTDWDRQAVNLQYGITAYATESAANTAFKTGIRLKNNENEEVTLRDLYAADYTTVYAKGINQNTDKAGAGNVTISYSNVNYKATAGEELNRSVSAKVLLGAANDGGSAVADGVRFKVTFADKDENGNSVSDTITAYSKNGYLQVDNILRSGKYYFDVDNSQNGQYYATANGTRVYFQVDNINGEGVVKYLTAYDGTGTAANREEDQVPYLLVKKAKVTITLQAEDTATPAGITFIAAYGDKTIKAVTNSQGKATLTLPELNADYSIKQDTYLNSTQYYENSTAYDLYLNANGEITSQDANIVIHENKNSGAVEHTNVKKKAIAVQFTDRHGNDITAGFSGNITVDNSQMFSNVINGKSIENLALLVRAQGSHMFRITQVSEQNTYFADGSDFDFIIQQNGSVISQNSKVTVVSDGSGGYLIKIKLAAIPSLTVKNIDDSGMVIHPDTKGESAQFRIGGTEYTLNNGIAEDVRLHTSGYGKPGDTWNIDFIQTKAVSGYALNRSEKSITVTVTGNYQTVVALQDSDALLYMQDDTTLILVSKPAPKISINTFSGSTAVPLSGVTVSVKDPLGKTTEYTTANGTLTYNFAIDGEYEISNTEAPEGYYVNRVANKGSKIKITVENGIITSDSPVFDNQSVNIHLAKTVTATLQATGVKDAGRYLTVEGGGQTYGVTEDGELKQVEDFTQISPMNLQTGKFISYANTLLGETIHKNSKADALVFSGAVGEGTIYFDNTNSQWDTPYIFLGHGSYVRSYAMTAVPGEDGLFQFTIQTGQWADATGFFFANSGGIVSGGSSTCNIGSTAAQLGVTAKTIVLTQFTETRCFITQPGLGDHIVCSVYTDIADVLDGTNVMFYVGEPAFWNQSSMYVRPYGATSGTGLASTSISEIGANTENRWGWVTLPAGQKYNLSHLTAWAGVNMTMKAEAGGAYRLYNDGTDKVQSFSTPAKITGTTADFPTVSYGDTVTLTSSVNKNISAIGSRLTLQYYLQGAGVTRPIGTAAIAGLTGSAEIDSNLLNFGENVIIPVITDGNIYVAGESIVIHTISDITPPANVAVNCSPTVAAPGETVQVTALADIADGAEGYYTFTVNGKIMGKTTSNTYQFNAPDAEGAYEVQVAVQAKQNGRWSQSVTAAAAYRVAVSAAVVDQKSQVFANSGFTVNVTNTGANGVKYLLNGVEHQLNGEDSAQVINGDTMQPGETKLLQIVFDDTEGNEVIKSYVYTKASSAVRAGVYANSHSIHTGDTLTLYTISKPVSESYTVQLAKDGVVLGDITNYITTVFDDNDKGEFTWKPNLAGEYTFTVLTNENGTQYTNSVTVAVEEGSALAEESKYVFHVPQPGVYTAVLYISQPVDYFVKGNTQQQALETNVGSQVFEVIDTGDGTAQIAVGNIPANANPHVLFEAVAVGNPVKTKTLSAGEKEQEQQAPGVEDVTETQEKQTQQNTAQNTQAQNKVQPVDSGAETAVSGSVQTAHVSGIVKLKSIYENGTAVSSAIAQAANAITPSGSGGNTEQLLEGKAAVAFINRTDMTDFDGIETDWDAVYANWEGGESGEGSLLAAKNNKTFNTTEVEYWVAYVPADAEFIYFSSGINGTGEKTAALRANTFAVQVTGGTGVPTYYPTEKTDGYYNCATPMQFIQSDIIVGDSVSYNGEHTDIPMVKTETGKSVYYNMPYVNALLKELEPESEKQYVFTSGVYRYMSVSNGSRQRHDGHITYNGCTYYYWELPKGNYSNVKFAVSENDAYHNTSYNAMYGKSYLFYAEGADSYAWMAQDNYNTDKGLKNGNGLSLADDRIGVSYQADTYNDWYTYKVPAGSAASFEIKGLNGASADTAVHKIYPVTGFEKTGKENNLNTPVYLTLNSDTTGNNGYYTDVSVYTYNPEEASVDANEQGEKSVYFVNNENWEDVYVYYWGIDSQTVSWPGVKMDREALLDNGYRCEIPQTAVYMVINNGKMTRNDGLQQTPVLWFTGKGSGNYQNEVLYDSSQNKNYLTMYANPRTKLTYALNYAYGVYARSAVYENYPAQQNRLLRLDLYKSMYETARLVYDNANSTARQLNEQSTLLTEYGLAYEALFNAVKTARIYLDGTEIDGVTYHFPEGEYIQNDSYTEYSLNKIKAAYQTAMKYYDNEKTKAMTAYEKGRFSIEYAATALQNAIAARKLENASAIQVQIKNYELAQWDETSIKIYLDGSKTPAEYNKYKTVLGNYIYLTLPDNTDSVRFEGKTIWGEDVESETLYDIQYKIETSKHDSGKTPVWIYEANAGQWYLKKTDVQQIKYSKITESEGPAENDYILKRANDQRFAVYFTYNTEVESVSGAYVVYAGLYEWTQEDYPEFWNNGVNLFSSEAKEYFTDETNYGMDEITLTNPVYTASDKKQNKELLPQLGSDIKTETGANLSVGWININGVLQSQIMTERTNNENMTVNFQVGRYYYDDEIDGYTLYLQLPKDVMEKATASGHMPLLTCKMRGGVAKDNTSDKVFDLVGSKGAEMEVFRSDGNGYVIYKYTYEEGEYEQLQFYLLAYEDGVYQEIWRTNDYNISGQLSNGKDLDVSGDLDGGVCVFADLEEGINTSDFNNAQWIFGAEYGDSRTGANYYPSGGKPVQGGFAPVYEAGETEDTTIADEQFIKKRNGKINFRFAYNTALDFSTIEHDSTVTFRANQVTFACPVLHGISSEQSLDITAQQVTGKQHFYIFAEHITFITNTKVQYYDWTTGKVKTHTYAAGTYTIKENELGIRGIDLFNPKAAEPSLEGTESKKNLDGGVYVK